MTDRVLRTCLAGLAASALVATWRSFGEYQTRKTLDRYREVAKLDYREAAEDPETTVSERLALLRGSAGGTVLTLPARPARPSGPFSPFSPSNIDSEIRTALALELVNAANAHLLAGHTDAEGEAFVAGHLSEALEEVRSALLANPTDTRAWLAGYRILESARLLGQTQLPVLSDQEGADYLNGAVRTNPNGGDLRRALATIMVSSGKRAEAFAQFRLALRDPSIDGVPVAGEMLDAGYAPDEVLAAVPRRFHDQYGAGEILLRLGHPGLAERAFLEAGQILPSAHEPWVALSRLAEGGGRHEEALAYARRGLQLLRETPPTGRPALLLCAAQASRSLGRADDAISFASQALAENPQNLFLYNFLGSVLFEEHDFEGAIRYWRSLLDDHANEPYVQQSAGHFHRALGRSYLEIGDRKRAMSAFFDALQVDANDREARAALGRLALGR